MNNAVGIWLTMPRTINKVKKIKFIINELGCSERADGRKWIMLQEKFKKFGHPDFFIRQKTGSALLSRGVNCK